MFENMLKHVLGKMCNRGVNVYGGDKFRPYLYVLTSNVHNGQVSNLHVFKKKKFLKNVSFCSLLPVVNTAHFRTSYKLIEK